MADHGQYADRSHLLRTVRWPFDDAHTVIRYFKETLPRKGETPAAASVRPLSVCLIRLSSLLPPFVYSFAPSPFIHPSIYSSLHLSFYATIHSSISQVRLSIRALIACLSIQLSSLSIHPTK